MLNIFCSRRKMVQALANGGNGDCNQIFFLSFQTYSHEVYVDKDLVLHIEQKPNRRFSCYVYQMVCDTAKDDECSSHEKTERVFCKKGEFLNIFKT